MLSNDISNAARCGVLDALQLQAKENPDIVPWIADQRALVIRNLKPIVAADASPLVELSLTQGGMTTFKETFVHLPLSCLDCSLTSSSLIACTLWSKLRVGLQ